MKNSKVFWAIVTMGLACFVLSSVNKKQGQNLFQQNIDALAATEVSGQCEESTNECMYVCQSCGAQYYARGHKGGSYSMSGSCSECTVPVL